MEVEPFIVSEQKLWRGEDQRLNDRLVTRPTISVVTRGSGTSQIDQFLWENLKKVMGSSMVAMLQAQQSQQQTTATPIAQAGSR